MSKPQTSPAMSCVTLALDGTPLDGHHRLAALAAMGVPIDPDQIDVPQAQTEAERLAVIDAFLNRKAG